MVVNFKTKPIIYLLPVIFLSVFSSCGYYSFKGALPSHLKTIAIPLFNNSTAEAGVQEELTNLLNDLFIEDNTLSLVDESKADLILTGSISSITIAPTIVQAGESVTESKLVVKVKVKCEDVVTGKVLINKNFEDYGLVDESAGLDERKVAITTALEQISDKIINATLGGW